MARPLSALYAFAASVLLLHLTGAANADTTQTDVSALCGAPSCTSGVSQCTLTCPGFDESHRRAQVGFMNNNTIIVISGNTQVDIALAEVMWGEASSVEFSSNTTILPYGLALNETTGHIHGHARRAGTYPLEIKWRDLINGTDNASNITILVTAPLTLPPEDRTYFVEDHAEASITLSPFLGGVRPFTYSVMDDEQLPRNMTIDAKTGVIRGRPTDVGDSMLVVNVEDALGSTITLNPIPITVLPRLSIFWAIDFSSDRHWDINLTEAVETLLNPNIPYRWRGPTAEANLTLHVNGARNKSNPTINFRMENPLNPSLWWISVNKTNMGLFIPRNIILSKETIPLGTYNFVILGYDILTPRETVTACRMSFTVCSGDGAYPCPSSPCEFYGSVTVRVGACKRSSAFAYIDKL